MKNIARIKKLVREEAAASTVFVLINGKSVSVRSVNGTQIVDYNGEQKNELIQQLNKIKSTRIIKTITLCMIIFFHLQVTAQTGDVYHNWGFSYGRTGTPGDQVKIGLEYGRTDKTSLYGEFGLEWSKYQGLRYSNISLAFGGRRYLMGNTLMTSKKKMNALVGLAGVAQYESESAVYKGLGFSDRLNYGISGQLLGEYFYDPTLGFFAAFEQKVLFQEALGKYNYSFAIGLRIHFNSVQ